MRFAIPSLMDEGLLQIIEASRTSFNNLKPRLLSSCMPRALGQFILSRMAARGLKQADLTGVAGLNSGQISKYLQGKNRFPPWAVAALVVKLRLEPADQDELHRLVLLSAAPKEVEDRVLSLEREKAALIARLAALTPSDATRSAHELSDRERRADDAETRLEQLESPQSSRRKRRG